jgi:hypothetical protein
MISKTIRSHGSGQESVHTKGVTWGVEYPFHIFLPKGSFFATEFKTGTLNEHKYFLNYYLGSVKTKLNEKPGFKLTNSTPSQIKLPNTHDRFCLLSSCYGSHDAYYVNKTTRKMLG